MSLYTPYFHFDDRIRPTLPRYIYTYTAVHGVLIPKKTFSKRHKPKWDDDNFAKLTFSVTQFKHSSIRRTVELMCYIEFKHVNGKEIEASEKTARFFFIIGQYEYSGVRATPQQSGA